MKIWISSERHGHDWRSDYRRERTMHVEARRWFNPREGNTYHTVTIYHPDEEKCAYSGITYGYGDAWLDTARRMDDKCAAHLGAWHQEGITYSVIDVARKRYL